MILNQNKGQITSLLTFIVGGIIIGVFFAGWMFFFNRLTVTMQSITTSTSQVNISSAVTSVLVPINNAMNGLNAISVAILIGLIMGMFVEVYYVRKHPIMFAVHLMVVIMAILASLYIANAYENLMSDLLIGSYLTANTGLSFLTLNLPSIVTAIGFLGLIFMFIAINRDPEHTRGSI